jgi:hypothetical protein
MEEINILDINQSEKIPEILNNYFPNNRKFERIGVHKDGSCLFHAFFYCMYKTYKNFNSQKKAEFIEKKRIDFSKKLKKLLNNSSIPEKLEDLKNSLITIKENEEGENVEISLDLVIDNFIEDMSNSSFWGNDEAIISLEYIYNKNIIVFQYNNDIIDLYLRAQELNRNNGSIILFNYKGIHFEPIIEITGNTKITEFKFQDKVIKNIDKKIRELHDNEGKEEETGDNDEENYDHEERKGNETVGGNDEEDYGHEERKGNEIGDNKNDEEDYGHEERKGNEIGDNKNDEDNKGDKKGDKKDDNEVNKKDDKKKGKNDDNGDDGDDGDDGNINSNGDNEEDMYSTYIKAENVKYLNNTIEVANIKIFDIDPVFIEYRPEKLLIEIVKLLSRKKINQNVMQNLYNLYQKTPYKSNINKLYNNKFVPIVSLKKIYNKEEDTDFPNINDEDLKNINYISKTNDYLIKYLNIKNNKNTSYFSLERQLYNLKKNIIFDEDKNLLNIEKNIDVYNNSILCDYNKDDEQLKINNYYSITNSQYFRLNKNQKINTIYTEENMDCKLNRISTKHNYEIIDEIIYSGDKVKIIGFITNINENINGNNIVSFEKYYSNIEDLEVGNKIIIEFNDFLINKEKINGEIESIKNGKYTIKCNIKSKKLIYDINNLNNGYFIFPENERLNTFNKKKLLEERYLIYIYKNSIEVTLNLINYTVKELINNQYIELSNLITIRENLINYGYDINNIDLDEIELINNGQNQNSINIFESHNDKRIEKIEKHINNKFSDILNFKNKKLNYLNKNKKTFSDTNLSRINFINKLKNLGLNFFIENYILMNIESEKKEYEKKKFTTDLSVKKINEINKKLSLDVNKCKKIKITYHFTSIKEIKELENTQNIEENIYVMIHLDNYRKILKKSKKKWELITILSTLSGISKCDSKMRVIYDELSDTACIYDKYEKICINSKKSKLKFTKNLLEEHIECLINIENFLEKDINNNLEVLNQYTKYVNILSHSIILKNIDFLITYVSNDNRTFIGLEDYLDFEEENLNIDNYENPGVEMIDFNEKLETNNKNDKEILELLNNILLFTGLDFSINLSNDEKLLIISNIPKFIQVIWKEINKQLSNDGMDKKEKAKYKKRYESKMQKNIIISQILILIFEKKKNIKIHKNEYNSKYLKNYSLKNLIDYFVPIVFENLFENLSESDKELYPIKNKEQLKKSSESCIKYIKDDKNFLKNFIKIETININTELWKSYKPKIIDFTIKSKSKISNYISEINLIVKKKTEEHKDIIKERNLLQFYDNIKIEKNINFYNDIILNKNIDIVNKNSKLYEILISYFKSNENILFLETELIFRNIEQNTTDLSINNINSNDIITIEDQLKSQNYLKRSNLNIYNIIGNDNEDDWDKLITFNSHILESLKDKLQINIDTIITIVNETIRDNILNDKINNEIINFINFDIKNLIVKNMYQKIKLNKSKAIEENTLKIIDTIINKSINEENSILLNDDDIKVKLENILKEMLNIDINKIFNIITPVDVIITKSIKCTQFLIYLILRLLIELYLSVIEDEYINDINIDKTEDLIDKIYEKQNNNNKNFENIEKIIKNVLTAFNTKIILNTRTFKELERYFEELREGFKSKQLEERNKLTDEERAMYQESKNILGQHLEFEFTDVNEVKIYDIEENNEEYDLVGSRDD